MTRIVVANFYKRLHINWGLQMYVSLTPFLLPLFLFVNNLYHFTSSRKPSDWYSVTRKQLIALGGRTLFMYHKSVGEAVMEAFPDFPWQADLFVTRHPKSKLKVKKHRDPNVCDNLSLF
jgi:hypothetical protein